MSSESAEAVDIQHIQKKIKHSKKTKYLLKMIQRHNHLLRLKIQQVKEN